jgi:hypothetical protein
MREHEGPEARAAEVAPKPDVVLAMNPATATVLALQRSAGNAAVARAIRHRDGLIGTRELASRWQRARGSRTLSPTEPGVLFRVPTAAEITSMMAAKDVPEAKIKESVQTALTRMSKDSPSQLKTKDSVADIMKRLFPAPGTFDAKEFEKVVDVADRSKVYEKAADAEAKLTPADKPKLILAMDAADKLIDAAIADAANLVRVFGARSGDAKANYTKAKAALATLKLNIDTNVHTDYNGDDAQVGLGGWASFARQMVHLEPGVASGADPVEAAMTIVHECAHLADGSVKDKGYYPASAAKSGGWEGMTEDEKVTNAAHYEEIPRRQKGISVYKADQEFKPGIAAGGGAVPFKSKVRRRASEDLRMAWDAAVDVHMGLRRIRVEIEKGSDATFQAKKARILEVSKLEKLTIHEQPTPKKINVVDLTLSEGVAHGVTEVQALAEKAKVPDAPVLPKTEQDYAEEVVADAAKAYGALTGAPATDKLLLDWLKTNYGATGLL